VAPLLVANMLKVNPGNVVGQTNETHRPIGCGQYLGLPFTIKKCDLNHKSNPRTKNQDIFFGFLIYVLLSGLSRMANNQ
jgi:hypothetical protein